ncbi:MAG TPA: Tad domain-containing protein [Acidimicrobiales bacterium]|nr:Tad domain-containing protein [Acidimicrobiales bacterium]
MTSSSGKPRAGRRRGRDEGMVTAFVVIFATGLLAMTGLVLDGGRILVTYREAKNVADSAARAGAQAVDETARRTGGAVRLDAAEAETLACELLADSHYPCGTNARVFVGADTVRVEIHKDVDMWLLQGTTSSLDVEGNACVAVGIDGPRTACG